MQGVQVITNEGMALLRKASSTGNKIVFTRARAGSRWCKHRGPLCSKPISWYGLKNGKIAAVSNAAGFLSVIASFDAVSGDVEPIKSVCICAQMLKSSGVYRDADDVIVATVSNDNSAFTSADTFCVRFDLPTVARGIVDEFGASSGTGEIGLSSGDWAAFVKPQIISRGEGKAPYIQVGIGGYLLVRCSSHLKALLNNDSTAALGHEFTVTQAMVMNGQAPYTPVNVAGKYEESGPFPNTKAFIGPGTYMIICGASMSDNDSVISVVRVA